MIVRMWEALCVPGQLEEAVRWIRDEVAPAALRAGATAVEVLRSDERVVLQTRWHADTGWAEPEADRAIIVRAHAWPFRPA